MQKDAWKAQSISWIVFTIKSQIQHSFWKLVLSFNYRCHLNQHITFTHSSEKRVNLMTCCSTEILYVLILWLTEYMSCAHMAFTQSWKKMSETNNYSVARAWVKLIKVSYFTHFVTENEYKQHYNSLKCCSEE